MSFVKADDDNPNWFLFPINVDATSYNTHQTHGGFTCACGKQQQQKKKKKKDKTLSTSLAQPHHWYSEQRVDFFGQFGVHYILFGLILLINARADGMSWRERYIYVGAIISHNNTGIWTFFFFFFLLRFATFRKIESHWSSSLWLLKKKLRNTDPTEMSRKNEWFSIALYI